MQQFCDVANCLCISLMKCKERKQSRKSGLFIHQGRLQNTKNKTFTSALDLLLLLLLLQLARWVVIKYLFSLQLFALINSQKSDAESKPTNFAFCLFWIFCKILSQLKFFGICLCLSFAHFTVYFHFNNVRLALIFPGEYRGGVVWISRMYSVKLPIEWHYVCQGIEYLQFI